MDEAAHEPTIPAVVYIDGETIDWWRPDRSGDDAADYAAGRRVFGEAQAMAAQNGAFGLLCSFVVAMREPRAYELGFLDAFAMAAARCPAPCLYTDQHIAEQVALMGAYAHDREAVAIRQGNEAARLDRLSALTDGPGAIVREILLFVLYQSRPYSAAYLHSISMAACRGAMTIH